MNRPTPSVARSFAPLLATLARHAAVDADAVGRWAGEILEVADARDLDWLAELATSGGVGVLDRVATGPIAVADEVAAIWLGYVRSAGDLHETIVALAARLGQPDARAAADLRASVAQLEDALWDLSRYYCYDTDAHELAYRAATTFAPIVASVIERAQGHLNLSWAVPPEPMLPTGARAVAFVDARDPADGPNELLAVLSARHLRYGWPTLAARQDHEIVELPSAAIAGEQLLVSSTLTCRGYRLRRFHGLFAQQSAAERCAAWLRSRGLQAAIQVVVIDQLAPR